MFNNTFPDIELPFMGGQDDIEGECTQNVRNNNFLEVKNVYGKDPRSINLQEMKSPEQILQKVRSFAGSYTNLKPSTIQKLIRYLERMTDINQPFPLDLLNPSYPQFIYHMSWYRDNYYDQTTGKNFYSLKQKRQAFYLYLRACGIPIHFFEYNLPVMPPEKPIAFPNPNDAYKIVRHTYFKDRYENRLYNFIHLYNSWYIN